MSADPPVGGGPPDDDPRDLRQPVWSPEAEQNVLGVLLNDNATLAQISDLVVAASFHHSSNRMIFGAIEALVAESKPADVISVFDLLHAQADNDTAFGGLNYLTALCETASARHIRPHAELIAEKAAARSLIASADEAVRISWELNCPLADRLDRINGLLRQVEEQRKLPAANRVPLLSLAELKQASQSVRWLVKRVLPADSMGMLFGGPDTFKSFIALDAALHVAHGLPWLGCKTVKGPVIYIAAEGGASLWNRIDAWHRARNLRWQDIDFKVVRVPVDLAVNAWRVVNAAKVLGVVPVLVAVDTFSQTYAGDENAANEIAAYLREVGSRFRALWRCCVLLLHHTGHAATERPRGSSAMHGNLDFLIGAQRDEREMMATISCMKQKDGERFSDATFSLAVRTLGTDDDGDNITSLVAWHLSSSEEIEQAAEVEVKAGRGGPNQMLVSLLQNGIKESTLRKAFYDQSKLEKDDAKRQSYGRAKRWCMERGYFEIADADQGRDKATVIVLERKVTKAKVVQFPERGAT